MQFIIKLYACLLYNKKIVQWEMRQEKTHTRYETTLSRYKVPIYYGMDWFACL